MAPPLLHLRDIHLTFGGAPVLAGAEIALGESERICLVGRNGSGKSTLLKIAAGLIEADHGDVWMQPGTTIRYLPQEPDLSAYASTLAYVEAGLGPADDPHRARYLLESLGLAGAEDPAHLSGGEKRRAALARVLAPAPDILLLDEPTNHLDIDAIQWLEDELAASRTALVLISHDRRFLERLSTATVWLDRGAARRMERGFAHFEEWRDKTLEEEETARHKLDRKIVMEEHWLRYGVTARRKRNVKRLAGLFTLRQSRREAVTALGQVKLDVGEAGQSGKLVAEAKKVSKSFGETQVVSDLNLIVLRGDRLAIAGPNGAGKTTLLRLIMGELAPNSGTIRLGTNLESVVLDQNRDKLDPEDTLANAIAEGRGDNISVAGSNRHVVSYMKDFLFPPEQARTPVGVLSGGERARIMLARAFAKQSNLMVLDEPTNDLDLDTLDLLEEKIADYSGTVLLVSHDRDFIDRIATSTLMPDRDGRWIEYAGGYTDAMAQKQPEETEEESPIKALKREAPAASQAKRKLSFKEKHRLEKLPGEIDALTAEIAVLEAKLADPAFFARDSGVFEKTAKRLSEARAALHKAEEDWLALAELEESLAG
jgi:ABC transport system ATP-binding/permease protein